MKRISVALTLVALSAYGLGCAEAPPAAKPAPGGATVTTGAGGDAKVEVKDAHGDTAATVEVKAEDKPAATPAETPAAAPTEEKKEEAAPAEEKKEEAA